MKKFVSIVLIAAMMLSLTSVTIFAQDSNIAQGNSINITFTAPQIGDDIKTENDPLSISAESSSLSISRTSVLEIYDGTTVANLQAVTSSEELSAFYENNKQSEYESGKYAAKDYVVIFTVAATSIPSDTKFAFEDGITGGTLYLTPTGAMLYGYIEFTPSPAPQSQSADVLATYQEPEEPEPVYSVNISFDSMKFIYTAESKDNWNSTEDKYDKITPASWSFANNSITVTNHSNVPITASFSYAAASGFVDVVNGSFTNGSKEPLSSTRISLSSADDTSVGAITSTTVYLLLEGKLPPSTTEETKCGTVTVTIQ